MSELRIPARPTTYKGIQMRSRLEARLAADLDLMQLRGWQYEPRAFADETGQYLPDFVLRADGLPPLFIEAKPTISAAYRVLPRMQIIWSSEPDATLMVFVPVDGDYVHLSASGRDRRWKLYR